MGNRSAFVTPRGTNENPRFFNDSQNLDPKMCFEVLIQNYRESIHNSFKILRSRFGQELAEI